MVKPAKKLKDFKTQWEKTLSIITYLSSQLTNGERVFKTAKDNNPNSLFLRVRPSLEKSANFFFDGNDPNILIKAMDDELNENHEYLDQIIHTAANIATRVIPEFSRNHFEMFEKVLRCMEKKRLHEEAIYIAQAILDKHSINGNSFKA